MKAIWQMWESEIDDLQIAKIIQECEFYDPQVAKTGLGDDGQVDSHTRRSIVRWVNPQDKNSKFITELLWYYANLANRAVFGVNLSEIYDIQYTIYDSKDEGHYEWHYDTFWGNERLYDRKLSITVQLSDGDDYEGGDFILDRQYYAPDPMALRKKGTILVFPSPIKHKVTKVIKGTRKSLVAWVEGPKWR